MSSIKELATLIKTRNDVTNEISKIIERPALVGHVGEYIASKIFDIKLSESATQKGIDGYFTTGPITKKSVNVKFYGKQEGILDINPNGIPDYYLVLAGPRRPAASSRGEKRPWIIEYVFLFNSDRLIPELTTIGVKIGIATSVRKYLWEESEIYPNQRNNGLILNESQKELLKLFS